MELEVWCTLNSMLLTFEAVSNDYLGPFREAGKGLRITGIGKGSHRAGNDICSHRHANKKKILGTDTEQVIVLKQAG
jgi:hypothetical protein